MRRQFCGFKSRCTMLFSAVRVVCGVRFTCACVRACDREGRMHVCVPDVCVYMRESDRLAIAHSPPPDTLLDLLTLFAANSRLALPRSDPLPPCFALPSPVFLASICQAHRASSSWRRICRAIFGALCTILTSVSPSSMGPHPSPLSPLSSPGSAMRARMHLDTPVHTHLHLHTRSKQRPTPTLLAG